MEVTGELNHLLFHNTQADDADIPRTVAIAVENVDLDNVPDTEGGAGLVADDECVRGTLANTAGSVDDAEEFGEVGGCGRHGGKATNLQGAVEETA